MWLHYFQSNYTIFYLNSQVSHSNKWYKHKLQVHHSFHTTHSFLQTLQSIEISQNFVPYSLSRLLLVTRSDKIFSGLNLFLHNNNNYLLTYVVHFKVVSLVFYAVIITIFGEQEAYGMTVILFLARNACTEKADLSRCVWSR
jgi:hypothetical protein